ncbi:MAG: ubiquitin-like domain-containing protein [Promethearchaeota archaeon]
MKEKEENEFLAFVNDRTRREGSPDISEEEDERALSEFKKFKKDQINDEFRVYKRAENERKELENVRRQLREAIELLPNDMIVYVRHGPITQEIQFSLLNDGPVLKALWSFFEERKRAEIEKRAMRIIMGMGIARGPIKQSVWRGGGRQRIGNPLDDEGKGMTTITIRADDDDDVEKFAAIGESVTVQYSRKHQKTIDFDVRQGQTIMDLKEMIEEDSKGSIFGEIPIKDQHIMFSGKILRNEYPFAFGGDDLGNDVVVRLVSGDVVRDYIFTRIADGWEHRTGKHNPVVRYHDLVKEFGVPDPHNVDSRKGGMIFWTKEELADGGHCLERLELHDESLSHLVPTPHKDFLYTWFRVNSELSDKTISVISLLSESVTYDPLKRLIRARCHFMGANVATIWLIMFVIIGRGKYTTATAALKKAQKMYGPTIFKTIPNTPKYENGFYEKMVKDLCNYKNTGEMASIGALDGEVSENGAIGIGGEVTVRSPVGRAGRGAGVSYTFDISSGATFLDLQGEYWKESLTIAPIFYPTFSNIYTVGLGGRKMMKKEYPILGEYSTIEYLNAKKMKDVIMNQLKAGWKAFALKDTSMGWIIKNVIKELGIPDLEHIGVERGQSIVWRRSGKNPDLHGRYRCFEWIAIKDVYVRTRLPFEKRFHNSPIYAAFDINQSETNRHRRLSADEISVILSLFKDVTYDQRRTLLLIRGNSLGVIVSILYLILFGIKNRGSRRGRKISPKSAARNVKKAFEGIVMKTVPEDDSYVKLAKGSMLNSICNWKNTGIVKTAIMIGESIEEDGTSTTEDEEEDEEMTAVGEPIGTRDDYGKEGQWSKFIIDEDSIKDVTKESEEADGPWNKIPKRPPVRKRKRKEKK